jgi:hypothetical protein
MSKPNAATPSTPNAIDRALVAEGDATDVTTADIRSALGMPPAGTKPSAEDNDDPASELSPEEQAAAQAELDNDADLDGAEPLAAEPAATENEPAAPAATPSAELTALQTKLDEATAATFARETELAAAREKLAAFEAESTTRTDAGVLDTITDLDSLAAQRSRFVNLYSWAVKHADGGSLPDGKGGELELSREEVANLQADAYTLVQDGIPKREVFLRAAAAREADALNAYPWIKETTRGIGAEAAKLLASAPALRRLPEAKLLAADSVIGARLRAAGVVLDEATLTKIIAAHTKPAAGAKPAALSMPPRVPPASPSRPGVVPPRTRGNESAVRAAAQAMQRTRGSQQSIEASIAAKLAG